MFHIIVVIKKVASLKIQAKNAHIVQVKSHIFKGDSYAI